MKDYLFIGGYFSPNDEKEIFKNSILPVQYAANEFQKNIIDGLEKNKDEKTKFRTISAPFIGAFPTGYKKMFFKTSEKTEFVDFFNFFAIKNIFRKKNLRKLVHSYYLEDLKNNQLREVTIFVYSPHNPFLEVAIELKEKVKSAHICLIVPDLPQYMNLSSKQSVIYKNLKKIDLKKIEKNLKKVDSYVLLTEEMKKPLSISRKPFCIIEGIVNTEITPINQSVLDKFKLKEKEYILYTGTLNQKFGVVDLLNSFLKIEKKKNIKLVIAGRGDSETLIEEISKREEAISYLGQVTNLEAKSLQAKALFLINPRNNDEEFTKYSFPSKNMEYLISGRPVIAYKLDGIPSEYNNIFQYVENSLENQIEKLISMSEDELEKIGRLGKEFALNKKNSEIQTRKIISMVEGDMINVSE